MRPTQVLFGTAPQPSAPTAAQPTKPVAPVAPVPNQPNKEIKQNEALMKEAADTPIGDVTGEEMSEANVCT
jgi:antitoxin (DNA-binding transcriptional repressor) of toxin-antitoxin stability system